MYRDQTATLAGPARHHTVVLPLSGHSVAMVPGDTLEVRLRQIGGSGAVWQVARTPSEVIHERDEHFGPGTQVTGAFSTRLFHFRALRPGHGPLRLTVGRPGDLEPQSELVLHVSVLPAG